MRRVLQFLHPARDFRCDFLVIFDGLEAAASLSSGVEAAGEA